MRFKLLAVAAALVAFAFAALAQDDRKTPQRGNSRPKIVDGFDCPICSKHIDAPSGNPPATCPHCGAKLTAVDKNGEITLTGVANEENKLKKPLIYGGGGLLVVGLIALILKYTVFKSPPPKKKKKRIERDEDDDEDDRPRKVRKPQR